MPRSRLISTTHDAWEERHVRPGQDRHADDVDVLLLGGVDDHLRRLPQARIDHLEPFVAQPAGEDLGAAVVPVEARLGDQDADRVRSGLIHARRF
jgi:hypothetical protein